MLTCPWRMDTTSWIPVNLLREKPYPRGTSLCAPASRSESLHAPRIPRNRAAAKRTRHPRRRVLFFRPAPRAVELNPLPSTCLQKLHCLAFAALSPVHQHGRHSFFHPPGYVLRSSCSGQNHCIARRCQKSHCQRISRPAEERCVVKDNRITQIHHPIVRETLEISLTTWGYLSAKILK